MLIDAIDSPEDLRRLDAAQLDRLAGEIRQFIVERVAEVGGHLGSNLGVVELTLALHRVFDSPHDPILWDTGHQAYVHKLVTGRRESFTSLRQAGGLSGYPSKAESPHDWIENSHASTALSYAHGLAGGFALTGQSDRTVVAVVGDGALTGGMAYEALNNIGHSGRRAMIVLNDNGRSYAPTISKLSSGLSRLRLHPAYRKADHELRRVTEGRVGLTSTLVEGLRRAKRAVREVVEPRSFFELLGLRYVGPFDGHDIALLEDVFTHARESDVPIVVHVVTQKGRGYAPAEGDAEKHLHDTSAFDITTGAPEAASSVKYTQVFGEAMVALGEEHDDLVAITAAMPGSTGLLPFAQRYPDRFVDVGIAEQHGMTMAAGMTWGGAKPVLAIYSTFMGRAFDQLHYDVGLHGRPVVLALDRAGITGPDGASHHGLLDLGLCLRIPGMTVLAPSSSAELRVMMATAVSLDGPASVRFPKASVSDDESAEVGEGLKARRVCHGDQVCLLAVGPLLAAAESAAAELEGLGLSCSVWDVRAVKPLDTDMLADAARHRLVVTAEDGLRIGGAGEYLNERLVARGDAPPVVVLGAPDAYLPHGERAQILAELGLDAAGMSAAVRKSWAALTGDER